MRKLMRKARGKFRIIACNPFQGYVRSLTEFWPVYLMSDDRNPPELKESKQHEHESPEPSTSITNTTNLPGPIKPTRLDINKSPDDFMVEYDKYIKTLKDEELENEYTLVSVNDPKTATFKREVKKEVLV